MELVIDSSLFRRSVSARLFLSSSIRGSNSAVECQLPKLDVAGSIPVSRSIFLTRHSRDHNGRIRLQQQTTVILAKLVPAKAGIGNPHPASSWSLGPPPARG